MDMTPRTNSDVQTAALHHIEQGHPFILFCITDKTIDILRNMKPDRSMLQKFEPRIDPVVLAKVMKGEPENREDVLGYLQETIDMLHLHSRILEYTTQYCNPTYLSMSMRATVHIKERIEKMAEKGGTDG